MQPYIPFNNLQGRGDIAASLDVPAAHAAVSFSPHILDRAAFQLRPLKGPIAASEALRDKEGALHEELHLESTAPLVSPQLTPKVRVIRFADELEEPFAKRRLSRRGRFPTRRVERFVNHGSAL